MGVEYKFIALLANADSSILNIRLGDRFAIEMLDESEFLDLVKKLEGGITTSTHFLLSLNYLNENERKGFMITRPMDISENDISNGQGLLDTVDEFRLKHEEGHLNRVMNLLLLFKEGALAAPDRYYLEVRGKNVKRFMSSHETQWIPLGPKYSINDAELESAHNFLEVTQLPFKQAYLKLAFDNMLESYRTPNPELSFLSLMMAVEALFTRQNQELSYSVSRNAAVLLGEDLNESSGFFTEMNSFYKKRSRLVHGVTKNEKRIRVSEDDVLRLRWFVRESIKEIYRLKISKNNLHKMLTSSGFGSRESR